MANAFIDIPRTISSQSVDAKLPLFQRRFGIRYEFNTRARKVTFSGEQARVDEACDELRDALLRLEISGDTRSSTKPSVRCYHFHAASKASSHSWQFVRTSTPVSDVNTTRFPYELVKCQEVSTSATQDTEMSRSGPRLLLDFSDAYVASAVQFLSERTPSGENLSLKAVFGRKLFRITGGIRPKTEYSQRDVQAEHRKRGSLQSSWSNVCDTENPSMQALIADLRSVARQLPDQNEPSERISVYLKLLGKHDSQIVAQYAREYTGKWTLARCEVKAGNRFVFDTALDSDSNNSRRMSFRVRVFSKMDPPNDVLERVLGTVQVEEPKDATDVFAARVNCSSVPSADGVSSSHAVEIEWVSIKTELVVPFEGLVFMLIQLKDELQLEVELPRTNEDRGGKAEGGGVGNRFSQLMDRLQAVLSKY